MAVIRYLTVCALSALLALEVESANAAILYQFTTLNSSTAPNDDGYVPADVTIVSAPGIIGPVDGTSLGLGGTTLSRFWNSEFAGFSLSSANGNTIDTNTEFNTGYFTWTVSATPGNILNLTSLDFGSAVGGGGTRGFDIYATVNGGAFAFGDAPIFALAAETGTRTSPVARSIDLSGPAYQGIDSITFRYYSLTPTSSNTIDFTGMTLNGEVTAIPEPSSVLLVLGSAAGMFFIRRRMP
jgi:hypothetical protein